MSEEGKLHRSESSRMVGGVCGGLGEFLGVDPTIVRVVFVLLALVNGIGVLLYVIMLFIVPRASRTELPPREVAKDGFDEVRDQAKWGVGEARRAVERLRGGAEGSGGAPGTGASGEGGIEPPPSEPGEPPER